MNGICDGPVGGGGGGGGVLSWGLIVERDGGQAVQSMTTVG